MLFVGAEVVVVVEGEEAVPAACALGIVAGVLLVELGDQGRLCLSYGLRIVAGECLWQRHLTPPRRISD